MKEIDYFIKVAEMTGWRLIDEKSRALGDKGILIYSKSGFTYEIYFDYVTGIVSDIYKIGGHSRGYYKYGKAEFLNSYKSYFRKIKIEKI